MWILQTATPAESSDAPLNLTKRIERIDPVDVFLFYSRDDTLPVSIHPQTAMAGCGRESGKQDENRREQGYCGLRLGQ